MKACSVLSVVFTVASFGLLVAALEIPSWYIIQFQYLANPSWYVIQYDQAGVDVKFESGLFQNCANDNCESNEYNDNPDCDRSGSSLESRVFATVGLSIASMIMSVIGAATALAGMGSPKIAAGSLLFGILAATTAGCGVALFVYTIENWYYCDKTFCEFYNPTNCENDFGLAFYLAAASVICAIVGFVCQLVAVLTSPTIADDESPTSGSNEPVHRDEGAYQESSPAPPEGDWVYDESCGLYWSDAEYLYLDTNTNQYYDPKSGQWYDPESQSWYFRD
mmetsp:Transcript_53241/g.163807  ORF Transcript_53241/g.163807 Transcript_53241/m.163807 type:complete len:279 (-) Transcript_53241:60-896(-)